MGNWFNVCVNDSHHVKLLASGRGDGIFLRLQQWWGHLFLPLENYYPPQRKFWDFPKQKYIILIHKS